ncbi:hypothetical protein ElyMa_003219600 [Elysia marginata]|uniref:Uncharacterized protein n=1 Tax=Elysia marginata TaxID=1093978 RepID=A0AAV4J3X0_9GAST|nr:hypothetical protein ElyMa_003219600 [Elysia marginata]
MSDECFAHSDADVLVMGTASGHLDERSIMVRRYVKPSEGGSGPIKSMWIWLNRFSGTGILTTGKQTCDLILEDRHAKHSYETPFLRSVVATWYKLCFSKWQGGGCRSIYKSKVRIIPRANISGISTRKPMSIHC